MPSISKLEKLLDSDPEDAFVLYGLAHEYARTGDHQKAVDLYDRCLEVDPAYCYAYYHKARSLEALGRIVDARMALEAGAQASLAADDAHALGEMNAYLGELP